ncbi:MAG TPA: hypothetical protein VNO14_08170, partial [Blastocatellia bacterium]|nr:hypothetical protein [Blastocatellia bacterium]
MSESINLKDPLYKLHVRFSNGEVVQYIVSEHLDSRAITPDTRYAIISSFSCQNPSQCSETTVINLRDVTFIRTEQVTLEQLAAERRMAGIRTAGPSGGDDRV